MAPQTEQSAVRTIPVEVKWRDIIHLDIKDADLKKKTEAFLDKLEKSSFRYDEQGPDGKINAKELSGQAMLKSIAESLQVYKENPTALNAIKQAYSQMGMAFVDGKMTIGDHNRPFDGKVQNGAMTLQLDPKGALPIGISIGGDYLRGARYLGDDMRYHPVSIEGVLANELGHVAYRTNNNRLSDQIETVVITALGGPPRKVGTEEVQYTRNGNGAIQSLLGKKASGKSAQADIDSELQQSPQAALALLSTPPLPASGSLAFTHVDDVGVQAVGNGSGARQQSSIG